MYARGDFMERKWLHISLLAVACLLVSVVIVSTDSCRRVRHFIVKEVPPPPQSARSKLSDCVPNLQPDNQVRLTIAEIRNEPERTSVKVVAQAAQGATDFYVPQYSMSRGRWLIHDQGRAYLRDAECNEYKLKDRTPAVGKVPDSGRIQLKPGQAYELTLSFPRLLEEMKTGVLVYGNWVLPFSLP
jgi:hypothetical protein